MSEEQEKVLTNRGNEGEIDWSETEEYRATITKLSDRKKKVAKAVWVEAWVRAKDVESVDRRTRNVAMRQFELWWERNVE